jgi:spore germination protein KB
MYIIGTSLVMGGSAETGQDSWLTLLLSLPPAVPVMLIFGRIMKLCPERNFFEIAESLYGKTVGKILIVLTTWYSMHLGAIDLRLFSEFVKINTLPETPLLPIMMAMMLVGLYLAKSGIETASKWSVFTLPIILVIVILTSLLSINKWDISNFQPVLEHDFKAIASSSFSLLISPFTESVLILGVACAIKKEDSPYKMFLYALLISAAVLLAVILRNILHMGPYLMKALYFPSFVSVGLIDIGEFFTRIEGSITMNFILVGIVRLTVCLLIAAKGAARLFGMQNYRHILMPVGLLSLALCTIMYRSIMEMFDFEYILRIYKIPFHFLIPVAVWITAEWKMRAKKLPEASS